MEEFCKRLQETMKYNSINYKQLAEKLNISQAAMTNYKKGKILPTLKHFKEICIILDVSADYLLGLKEY